MLLELLPRLLKGNLSHFIVLIDKGVIYLKILTLVRNLKHVVQQNFEELSSSYHGKHIGFKVTSKEIEDRDIHGGLDIHSKVREIYITLDGWDMFTYEEETNVLSGRNGAEITEFSHITKTDEGITEFFNGENCTINEVLQFVKTYNNMKKEYNQLTKITDSYFVNIQ